MKNNNWIAHGCKNLINHWIVSLETQFYHKVIKYRSFLDSVTQGYVKKQDTIRRFRTFYPIIEKKTPIPVARKEDESKEAPSIAGCYLSLYLMKLMGKQFNFWAFSSFTCLPLLLSTNQDVQVKTEFDFIIDFIKLVQEKWGLVSQSQNKKWWNPSVAICRSIAPFGQNCFLLVCSSFWKFPVNRCR